MHTQVNDKQAPKLLFLSYFFSPFPQEYHKLFLFLQVLSHKGPWRWCGGGLSSLAILFNSEISRWKMTKLLFEYYCQIPGVLLLITVLARHTNIFKEKLFKNPKTLISRNSISIVGNSLRDDSHDFYLMVFTHLLDPLTLSIDGTCKLLLIVRIQQKWEDMYHDVQVITSSYKETFSLTSFEEANWPTISIWMVRVT